MTLFVPGQFTLASGRESAWKIECDTLTDEDWACLAAMLVQKMPAFRRVKGVPRGGLRFAMALAPYAEPDSGARIDLLLVDDVWTTGGSLWRHLVSLGDVGIVRTAVAFDRSEYVGPDYAVWKLSC